MSKVFRIFPVLTVLLALALSGCSQTAKAKVQVEKLAEVTPSLPAVPTLPPPPFPTTYQDGSYTVFGVRKQINKTIKNQVEVTGYIVKLYVPPPECPKDQKCPKPLAPHIYLADTPTDPDNQSLTLLVAGYAENQTAIDDAVKEAVKAAKRGKAPEVPPEETGILPIPTDFLVGAKVKVKGRFDFMTGGGFQSSEGVLEYGGHTTLQPAPEMAAAK